MSFFSRSKSNGHYPYKNHGGSYYKRPHSSGGILGKIIDALTGSGKHSRSYSDHHNEHYSNHGNGHYPGRRHYKSSWS